MSGEFISEEWFDTSRVVSSYIVRVGSMPLDLLPKKSRDLVCVLRVTYFLHTHDACAESAVSAVRGTRTSDSK